MEVLKRYGCCPGDDEIVQDFCANITDSRLDSTVSNVLVEGSPYVDNFEKTQRYLTNQLATELTRKAARKAAGTRNVSAAYVQKDNNNKTPFTGTLEAKNYPKKDWYNMTKAQKDKVSKLRKPANADKKRKLAAVSSETETTDESKDAGNEFGQNAHSGSKKKKV